jgi:Kdo2-lipid IVA lauroyltransferase/acyltransferase
MTGDRRPRLGEYHEFALAALLRRLPVDWTTAIGARFGERAARNALAAGRPWARRMQDNLRRLQGLEPAEARARGVVAFSRGVGGVYAQFNVLQRIVDEGRLEVVGAAHLASASTPCIVAGCHLANWELMGHAMCLRSNPGTALYLPPDNPVRHRLAVRARLAWREDFELVPASRRAMFGLSRALEAGRNLLLYVDEERDGHVMAPGLGRALPYAGNRWLAARLAVTHGVDIVPGYVERTAPARFRLVLEPPLVSHADDRRERARVLADALERRLDAWIRPRLLDWYWFSALDLDRPLPGVVDESTPVAAVERG